MVTEFIHTTTATRCCKQVFRILGRRINTEDKALKSKYLEFWKDKKQMKMIEFIWQNWMQNEYQLTYRKNWFKRRRNSEKYFFGKKSGEFYLRY